MEQMKSNIWQRGKRKQVKLVFASRIPFTQNVVTFPFNDSLFAGWLIIDNVANSNE
jgi:hypothetical protein